MDAKPAEADELLHKALVRAFNYVNPRVVCLSHVIRSTGQLLQRKTLQYFRESKPRVVIILDGCQAIGNVQVADGGRKGVLDLVDFYVGSGHKWLGGLTTSGFVWRREADYWNLPDPAQSTSLTTSGHQAGTGNANALLSLRLSIGDMLKNAAATRAEEIEMHNRTLAQTFIRGIRNLSGVSTVTPTDRSRRPPSGLVVIEDHGRRIGPELEEVLKSQQDRDLRFDEPFTVLHGDSVMGTAIRRDVSSRVRVVHVVGERVAPRIEPVNVLTADPPEPVRERLRFCFHYNHDEGMVNNLLGTLRGLLGSRADAPDLFGALQKQVEGH